MEFTTGTWVWVDHDGRIAVIVAGPIDRRLGRSWIIEFLTGKRRMVYESQLSKAPACIAESLSVGTVNP